MFQLVRYYKPTNHKHLAFIHKSEINLLSPLTLKNEFDKPKPA